MSAVEVFQFPATGERVRTFVRDGEPWFVAKDACDLLGISKHRDAVAQLDPDERASMAVDTPGGVQQMTVVRESGLYALMLISRSPKVQPFRRWVTGEVLPSIRKTGAYGTPKLPTPMSRAELARNWYEAELAREAAEEQLAIAAPKAEAWDTLASAHGDYSVREAAYILNRDPAIDTGQKRLFQLLRDWHLIDRRDIPYADHARHVRLRARSYTSPRSGEERTSEQVRITVEGLRYLHKRLGGTAPLSVDQPAA